MRILFITIFLLFCNVLAAQYTKKDSMVLQYPSNIQSTKTLSDKIKTDFTNDSDRARAAYTWLINNIQYDLKEWSVYSNIYGPYTFKTKEDSIRIELSRNDKTIKRVLRLKRAVCFGYSLVYSQLCNEMNIPCRVINGMGRTTVNEIGGAYRYNHNWNIVKLNGKELLIDVTWGVDIITGAKDYQYFLANPKNFILDHYPEKWSDALLDEVVPIHDFLNKPLYSASSLKLDIDVVTPNKAVVNMRQATQLELEFKTDIPVREVAYSLDGQFYHPTFEQEGKQLIFVADLASRKNQSVLRIFVNNEMFVSYLIRN